MMPNHQDPEYLMGRSEAERGRLQRQAQLYGPLTRQLFVDAGIGQGMRVLDVGSGVGDVALLVAELVGPTGAVVGIDPDAEALRIARARVAASGWQTITFMEGDIRTALLEGLFDAVVGRFVLIWVGDVVAVLHACHRYLRPGGIVAFQEHDVTAGSNYLAVPSSRLMDPWQRTMDAYGRDEPTQAAGTALRAVDQAIGYHLYSAFLEAGLSTPRMRYDAPIGGGPDWIGYETFTDHLRTVLSLVIQLGGATEAEIDIATFAARLREEVVGQRGVLRCLPAIGIWARWPVEDAQSSMT